MPPPASHLATPLGDGLSKMLTLCSHDREVGSRGSGSAPGSLCPGRARRGGGRAGLGPGGCGRSRRPAQPLCQESERSQAGWLPGHTHSLGTPHRPSAPQLPRG